MGVTASTDDVVAQNRWRAKSLPSSRPVRNPGRSDTFELSYSASSVTGDVTTRKTRSTRPVLEIE